MFLLAQASDLIYLFLLMFLSEHVFKVSKEDEKTRNLVISKEGVRVEIIFNEGRE